MIDFRFSLAEIAEAAETTAPCKNKDWNDQETRSEDPSFEPIVISHQFDSHLSSNDECKKLIDC